MPTPDENILNGVDPNEDAMIEEALRQDVSQVAAQRVAKQAAAPKVEVIQPARVTTLLVHIPADNPNGIKVTKVEKRADGTVVTLEEPRSPTSSELAMIKSGKREVLSGPSSETQTASDQSKRPWWHWALGGVAAVGAVAGTVLVVRHYASSDDAGPDDDDDDTEETGE